MFRTMRAQGGPRGPARGVQGKTSIRNHFCVARVSGFLFFLRLRVWCFLRSFLILSGGHWWWWWWRSRWFLGGLLAGFFIHSCSGGSRCPEFYGKIQYCHSSLEVRVQCQCSSQIGLGALLRLGLLSLACDIWGLRFLFFRPLRVCRSYFLGL